MHYSTRVDLYCHQIQFIESHTALLLQSLVYHWSSFITSQIARCMRPTWGPPGSCQPHLGPMLAPWTLLSRFCSKEEHAQWPDSTCNNLGLGVNTLRPRQNGRPYGDEILKSIFLNENVWIPIKISLKFVPKGPVNNIPALVQIMGWRHPGGKPLSEPVMVSLPTHVWVTRPQWVNSNHCRSCRFVDIRCASVAHLTHLFWFVLHYCTSPTTLLFYISLWIVIHYTGTLFCIERVLHESLLNCRISSPNRSCSLLQFVSICYLK